MVTWISFIIIIIGNNTTNGSGYTERKVDYSYE